VGAFVPKEGVREARELELPRRGEDYEAEWFCDDLGHAFGHREQQVARGDDVRRDKEVRDGDRDLAL